MASSTDHPTPDFEGHTRTIAETAEIAHELLLCCREIPSEEVSRIADAQFVRFKLWASNIGVFASRHASLDYRLRTSLTVRVTIQGNLENICGNLLSVIKGKSDLVDDELEELYELAPYQIQPFGRTLLHKSVANDEVRTRELGAVENTIGTLHRLSIAIRKASNRGLLTKLPKLVDIDNGYQLLKERTEDTENFEDPVERVQYETSSAFEGYVRDALAHRVFCSTNAIVLDDDQQRYRRALFDRCVTTICARRRQLVHFQRHQLKLSQRSAPSLKRIAEKTDNRPINLFPQKTDLSRSIPDTDFATPPLSETVGSELRSDSFSLAPPKSVASSTTSSNIDAAFGKESPFEVPPPPKVEEGEREKACSYCCLVLPIKTFSRSTAWKRHLLEDLQPYVCLFPNCSLQGKSYSSFKDWLAHLHQPHCHSWLCPLHTEKSPESSLKTLSFDSLPKFETHLKTNHPQLDPLTTKEVTREAGQHASLPKQCLICFVSFATAQSLARHMANHFKSMLLLALPWRDDVESEEEIISNRPTNSMEYDEASSVGLGGDDTDDSDVDFATKEFKAKLSCVEPMSVLDRVTIGNTNAVIRTWNSSDYYLNPKNSTLLRSDLYTLVSRLKDEDWRVRLSSAKDLINQSSLPLSILEALAVCLKDEDERVRSSAAAILGKYSYLPLSILEALTVCLKVESGRARWSAAEALRDQSSLPPSILDALTVCLKDQNWRVRSNAAEALRDHSSLPPSTLGALTVCLKDKDWRVRWGAAEALGNQSSLSPPVLDNLTSCLRDENRIVRSFAAEALEKHSAIPLPRLVIAVMGETGAGKSDFIQRVTQRLDVPVNHGIFTERKDITPYEFRLPSLDGYSSQIVELIDCPGYDDTSMLDHETVNSILDYLERTYKGDRKLDGIIYMIPITRPRLRGSIVATRSIFWELCGEDYHKKVVLATTHWDQADEAEAVKIETELKTSPRFWGEMIENGSTAVRLRRLIPHHNQETHDSPDAPSGALLPEPTEEDLSILRLVASRCHLR